MASFDNSRYFPNELSDEPTGGTDLHGDEFRSWCVVNSQRVMDKIMRRQHEKPSIYTGECGKAYVLMDMADHGVALSKDPSISSPVNLYESAFHIITREMQHFPPNRVASFLEGLSGCIAMQAVLLVKLQRSQEALSSLTRLLSLAQHVSSMAEDECEFLYGRAGYVYALHWTQRQIEQHDERNADIDSFFSQGGWARVKIDILRQILIEGLSCANRLAGNGIDLGGLPLAYEWHGKCYLGAAHGLAGILQVLLLCRSDLPHINLQTSGHDASVTPMSLISRCLNVLSSSPHMFPGGNVSSSVGSTHDRLVQWCHGAPGFLPVYVQAMEVFPSERERFARVALQMGEAVWQRGLLRKGVGLCHGIAGNAFALLSAYRIARDPKWLRRAQQFAAYSLEHFDDLRRIPDRPYSLFEGMGGLVCLLTQLRSPDRALFPAYE
ncbi:unnamed protein product [Vitrella brassicaformis CCMP3155]|uniref:Uncharacterized protein n=1 Tax=Vitrella brassicaformis (strain CCMP3155) TaxID=1169540 RepID=A0A0G4EJL0_VITBC|nr:unnamed protein product [Vitrella brassicaformis CCMP3155]|eukprot:CEL97459.1 unnamed protein product [Vitrella brassicaformis CCMP3155]